MSNKIVPATYRAIIDDVIASIKSEFDEYGVGEDVLAELQTKWENKVIASRVAEFEQPPPVPPHAGYPVHTMPGLPGVHSHYPNYLPNQQPPPPQHPLVKTEPSDNRYALSPPNGTPQYTLPPLAGPQINGYIRHPSGPTPVSAPQSTYAPKPPVQSNGTNRPAYGSSAPPVQSTNSQSQQPRIPQVDGPSSSSSDSPSPPANEGFAPRSTHPSLMQSALQSSSAEQGDNEEINSDLDDSDTDAEEEDQEGVTGETDIVFCTYDKVARVKNKWKCILKDGMVHINGKDYLFAKCNCEFEW